MRQIRIVRNTPVYQKALKTREAAHAGRHMSDQQLNDLPKDSYVLTGDKTKDFGGGPSPDGFAMSAANKILGRLRLEGKTSDNGQFVLIR